MPETHLTGFWGSSVKSPSGKGLPPVKNSSESSFYSKREAEAKENKKNAAPQEPKFKVGDRVQHKSFGLGRVLSLFGSKNQKFYSIEFDGADGKKLLSGDSLHLVES